MSAPCKVMCRDCAIASPETLFLFIATVALPMWRAFLLFAKSPPASSGPPRVGGSDDCAFHAFSPFTLPRRCQ